MEKKDFEILNRHGKRISASLALQENDAKGTCVVLHGLGGWKDQGVILAAVAAAEASGYITLRYNSANGAKAPDADFFNATTTGDFEDLEDVIAFIQQEEWYRAPLMLIGHSMGGLISTEYAARHAGALEKLILLAPGVSWRRFKVGLWFFLAGIWWGLGGKHTTPGPDNTTLRLGRNWTLDLFRFDEYKNAKRIFIPVLIVAAGKDTTVATPRHLKQFALRFPHAQFKEISLASHTFSSYETEVTDILREWLTQS